MIIVHWFCFSIFRKATASDIKISDEEIRKLAEEIEEQLFSLFNGDTGMKYKTRYRSLIFNIKDLKNEGLFRKILTGQIKPDHLVRMTADELASEELAEWRQKESQHVSLFSILCNSLNVESIRQIMYFK